MSTLAFLYGNCYMFSLSLAAVVTVRILKTFCYFEENRFWKAEMMSQSRTRRMVDMCVRTENVNIGGPRTQNNNQPPISVPPSSEHPEDVTTEVLEEVTTQGLEDTVPSSSSRKVPADVILHNDSDDFGGSSDDYIPSSKEDSSSDEDEVHVKRRRIIMRKLPKTTAHVEHVTADAVRNFEETTEVAVEKKSRGRKKREGQGSRKRLSAPKNWDKNVRKLLKTQGKPYLTGKGKNVDEKRLKDPCTCRKKCYEKLSLEERQAIFTSFYNLSAEAQNQFIANNIGELHKSVERLRRDKNKDSRRKYTRKYHIPKDSSRIEVCQVMFLNTLDLTLKKVRIITEKKRGTESGICASDARGKHDNHPKTPEQDKEEIRLHIKMFPTYESHYSRSHSAKHYLESDLSISKMYRLYIEHCRERNLVPRNEALYRKIFVEEFNLSFHKPSNDTCGTCDKFNLLSKMAPEDQKEKLEKEKKEHLTLADSVYAEKRADRKNCRSNPNKVVVSFDLQKCLPTPYLRSGISFYKRKLWTLNLTLFESRGDRNYAICYLWNETIANRGGLEIGSCLFRYLQDLPQHITEIVLYSDCCPGQNKNIYISLMFLTIVEEFRKAGRNSTTITHKFLVPGHTHMEADTIHAAIEKTKKNTTANIDIPRDWANLIRMVHRNHPIVVNEMQQCQFLNFKSLLGRYFQHRKINTLGEPVKWGSIRIIQYRSESFGMMYYKLTCDPDEQYKVLDLNKKATRNSQTPELKPISEKLLGIPENKHQHLRELIPYIDETSRPYYAQFLDTLTVAPEARDILTDDEDEGDDEDGI